MLATRMDPAGRAESVTPHDSNEIELTDAIIFDGAGDIVLVFGDGSEHTFTSLSAGVVYPFRVKQVKSSGTTATGIVALYTQPAKIS